MPVVYRCRNCGYVLYVFWRVGQDSYGVPTPSEVMDRYGGVCPRCGAKLRRPGLEDVEVVADRELVEARIRLLRGLLAWEGMCEEFGEDECYEDCMEECWDDKEECELICEDECYDEDG